MDPVDFVCVKCKHCNVAGGCPAFPDGTEMPEDILSGRNRHTHKHPDQVGDTIFEPLPDGQTIFDFIEKKR